MRPSAPPAFLARLFRKRVRLIAAVAAGSLALTIPTALPAPAQTCVRAPVLREANLNQGQPYGGAQLAREKDVFLKLHLSANGCPGGDLQVVDGTLAVTVAPEGLPPVSTFEVGLIALPSGKVEPCCAAATDSAGDPRFRIPGVNASLPGGGPVVLTFQATIGYREGTSARREVVFDGSSQPAPLSPAALNDTRPLRILVVPMGKQADGYRTWFPVSDEAIVLGAMRAFSRVMPLRSGVCSPIQAVPLPAGQRFCGVQYSIADELLDLARLGPARDQNVLESNGTFCGTSDNFKAIRVGLAERLAAYNIGNARAGGQGGPQRAADLVIGVINGAKSPNTSCAQGMAAVGANQSWIRLIPDASRSASPSGGIEVQEVAHNFGVRDPGRDDDFNPWHSPNSDADGGKNRSHNLVSLSYLPNDRTALRFSFVDWTNDNVLLEPVDWSCLLSALGGGGTCGIPVGSDAAAQGEALVITGRSDTTPGGSNFTTTVARAPEGLDGSSTDFTVAYKNAAGTVIEVLDLPGSDEVTHGEESSGEFVFDTALPFNPAARTIDIRNPDGQVVWTVDASTLAPSNVVAKVRPVGWSYENVSDGAQADTDPAISPSQDDPLVAWVRHGSQGCAGGGEVVVERLSDGARAESRCFTPAPQDLDISPDRSQIAMARNGNIEILAINGPDGDISLGSDVTTAYLCDPAGLVCREGQSTDLAFQGPGTNPAFSSDLQPSTPGYQGEIAFSVRQVSGGELASVQPGTGVGGIVPPRRLTVTPRVDERAPSWSHDPAERTLIVYERCEPSCGSDAPELATLDADPSAATFAHETEERLGIHARDPSWGDGFIAAQIGSRIVTIYPDDPEASESLRNVTGVGTGHVADASDPSIRGSLGPVAFVSPTGGQDDVWVASASQTANEISVTADDDTSAEDAAEINYAHMWVVAGGDGEARSVAVNVPPTTAEETPGGVELTFHATVDLARIEQDADVMVGVSDQANITFNSDDERPQLGGEAKAPYPAIAWPSAGAIVPSNQPLVLDGLVDDWQLGGESEGSFDNPGLSLTWSLDPPGPAGPTEVGTGARVQLRPPLTPGTYTAELEVREGGGGLSILSDGGCQAPRCRSQSVTFEVAGSGWARFDPATWHVPSSGVVTYRATFFGARAKDVTTAAITEVNGVPVTQKSGPNTAGWVKPAAAPFAATLKVDGDTLIAKVDRPVPNQFFVDNGLVGTRVVLTLEGTFSDGTTFQVKDYDRPLLQPV